MAEATSATPADSPSMLSSRLKALVMPTSQTRVTITFIHSKGMKEVRTPDATTRPAPSSWPAALADTGNRLPSMSSSNPTTNAMVAPASTARSFVPTFGASCSRVSGKPSEARAHGCWASVGARR